MFFVTQIHSVDTSWHFLIKKSFNPAPERWTLDECLVFRFWQKMQNWWLVCSFRPTQLFNFMLRQNEKTGWKMLKGIHRNTTNLSIHKGFLMLPRLVKVARECFYIDPLGICRYIWMSIWCLYHLYIYTHMWCIQLSKWYYIYITTYVILLHSCILYPV